MSYSKVLFLIGAGSNAGAAIARKFAQGGYKVALASRSATPGFSADGNFWIKLDATKPETIAPAFEVVEKELGSPSVVVFNASGTTRAEDPLSHPIQTITTSLNLNVVSVYAAAQAAVKAKADVTFIVTGNYLNIHGHPLPQNMDLGIGKSGAASLIESLSVKRSDQFFYADERKEDGTPMWKGITGEGTAEHYWSLAQPSENHRSWLQTFVAGKGYVPFEER